MRHPTPLRACFFKEHIERLEALHLVDFVVFPILARTSRGLFTVAPFVAARSFVLSMAPDFVQGFG